MSIVVGVVLPSSPVLVPEVGRGRERAAVRSIAACRRAGRLLRERAVETLVLLLECEATRPVLWLPAGGRFRRSFDQLDAPELTRWDEVDGQVAGAVLAAGGAEWERRESDDLPPSALGPLYFLSGDAALRVLPVGVPGGDLGTAAAVGHRLAGALDGASGGICVAAAGELSARVFPGAPGGYHPEAAAFDAGVVELVAARDVDRLMSISRAARRDADERLVPQLVALLAAGEALSLYEGPLYEAPFGEGYVVAVLDGHAAERHVARRGARDVNSQ